MRFPPILRVCCGRSSTDDEDMPSRTRQGRQAAHPPLSAAETAQLPGHQPLPCAEGIYRLGRRTSGTKLPPLMVGANGQQVLRGSLLGWGSFAKVYFGLDSRLRPVAVRVHRLPEREAISQRAHGPSIDKTRKTAASTLDAILAEQKVARLAKSVPAPYGAGVSEGRHFEFGRLMLGDLVHVFKRVRGPFRDKKRAVLALRVLVSGSRALATAHAANVLHNDIKPENFLVDFDSKQLQLCDYGGGTALDIDQSITVVAGGTPAYLAPELRHRGGQPSKKSDVWSLAATAIDIAVDRLGALRSENPEWIRQKLSDQLGSQLANFILDEVGAGHPDRRPSAARCAATFAALARTETSRSLRAAEELVDADLKTMVEKTHKCDDSEARYLADIWAKLRQKSGEGR